MGLWQIYIQEWVFFVGLLALTMVALQEPPQKLQLSAQAVVESPRMAPAPLTLR